MGSSRHPSVARAAFELAQEIRYGTWLPLSNFTLAPPLRDEALITELRSRCPGFERADYLQALEEGAAQSRATPPRTFGENVRYWFIALTFLWAFVPVNWLAKKIPGSWPTLTMSAYPAVCALAVVLLLRQKLRTPALWIAANLATGLAWIAFVFWAARAFAAHFWR